MTEGSGSALSSVPWPPPAMKPLMGELRGDDRQNPHVVRVAHVLSAGPPALRQQASHHRWFEHPGRRDGALRRDLVEPGGAAARKEACGIGRSVGLLRAVDDVLRH